MIVSVGFSGCTFNLNQNNSSANKNSKDSSNSQKKSNNPGTGQSNTGNEKDPGNLPQPEKILCPLCGGSGSCIYCLGTGDDGDGFCDACSGSGTCPQCWGEIWIYPVI